jgi:hypothetical protein
MMTIALLLVLQTSDPVATLDLLESKARSVTTIHAEFELDRLPQYSSIIVDFDPIERRLSWNLGRGPGQPADHYVVDQLRRTMWTDGQTGTTTDFQPYWGGFDRGFNSILASLLPDRTADSVNGPPMWGFGLGINLEGKQSRDARGSLQFYGTFYRVPYRWLGLLREESSLNLVMDEKTCTFLMPSRRKTVVLDRNTGFLRSIETIDYDGTARCVKCRSFELNKPLPTFPTPPRCREKPVSRQELEEILESRRHLFHDLLSAVLDQWDKVIESGRQGAVGKAYAQEISDLTATWWEARLHQMAAAGIQHRMDTGSSWLALKQGEAAEVRAFVAAVQDQCDVDRVILKSSLEDFQKSLESLYQKKVSAGADPASFRRLLRSAFQFDDIWRLQVQPDGNRPPEVFREELDHARQI